MNIVQWVVAVLLIASGAMQMVTGAPLSGLLYIAAGAACLPPLRETLADYKVKGVVKVAAVLALLVLATVLNPTLKSGIEDGIQGADAPWVEEPAAAPETPETGAETPLTGREKVEADLRSIVEANYKDTDVDSITLNENAGTDADGDYVALIYLTWNVKNKADTTKQMIGMYSEDFAARIGTEVPEVTDVAVFWTIPYFDTDNTAAKYSYERHDDGGMYQTDATWSAAVQ